MEDLEFVAKEPGTLRDYEDMGWFQGSVKLKADGPLFINCTVVDELDKVYKGAKFVALSWRDQSSGGPDHQQWELSFYRGKGSLTSV